MTHGYGGKCISGPYDGKMWAYPKKVMPVVWIDGAFMREGVYEFGDGIWRWNGPAYRPSAMHPMSQGEKHG